VIHRSDIGLSCHAAKRRSTIWPLRCSISSLERGCNARLPSKKRGIRGGRHMKTTLFRAGALLAASVALVAGGSSWCQGYPAKPIRLIIGGLPGTATDVLAPPGTAPVCVDVEQAHHTPQRDGWG